ncbi:MAG: DUF1127 domain-containing protein [Alphaproteobacteria bacterium]
MSFSHTTTAGNGRALTAAQTFGTFAATAQTLIRSIRTYLQNRRDYRHVLDLPDYLLKDIGVTRAEVKAAIRPSLF